MTDGVRDQKKGGGRDVSSLRDRLEQIRRATPEQTISVGPTVEEHDASAYYDLKVSIHGKLLDRIDLAALESIPEERLREELRLLVERLLVEDGVALNDTERRRIVVDIQNEVLGLGPLEPLLADTTISDILVNTYRQVYVERYGKLELTDVRFGSNAHLMKIIDRIVSRMGRRVDESSPMVDARLPDGSRVNAIIPPLALDGPIVSIRRFGVTPLRMRDLLAGGALSAEAAGFLGACVEAKLNILISGGTGAGTTTLLNA